MVALSTATGGGRSVLLVLLARLLAIARTDCAAPNALASSSAHCTAPDVRALPLNLGYPAAYPLSQILTNWNPNVTSIPAHYGLFSSLRLFNGSDPLELAEAETYRRNEVPFVVRRPPGLMPAVEKWTEAFLLDALGSTKMDCEINNNKNFMYYK